MPYHLQETENGYFLRQSSGGLVSAIKSYFEKNKGKGFEEVLWVGVPDCNKEKWQSLMAKQQEELDFELTPVFVNTKVYENYYNGFSNSILWPLFHYFPTFMSYHDEDYNAYKAVNELFAEQILSIAKKNDVIWIQDYHLFLLPGLLRNRMPDLEIGFFLHIPFPSFEIFRIMPRKWKQEILEGLLGADLIGFHTIEYRRYFLETIRMVLNVDNEFGHIYYRDRVLKAELFPIGIDYEKFNATSNDRKIIEKKEEIRSSFKEQKIIFSLDRLDYTKGVMQRLNGYQRFLQSNPDWHQKVVMVLNVIPSRDKLSKYSERKKMIEQKISNINGKFSNYTWQPIVYFYQHLDFENLCALYQLADVALITPLRDGMNLIAKEYVASRITQYGVLILSELAGAANELNEAILVNPIDEGEVASAIHQALNMSPQLQREKMMMMQKRIAHYDIHRWVDDFFSELQLVKGLQAKLNTTQLAKSNSAPLIRSIKKAKRRLLFFDYDGTLMPFTKLPSMAAPNEEVVQILSALTADESNTVVIISGRDIDTLDKWLGNMNLIIVAEHGALIKYPHRKWETLIDADDNWKKNVLPTLELFSKRCTGSFIEEKKYSLAWHYRNVQKQLGFFRSRELIQNLSHILANTPLQVVDGNKVIEVRIANINKGMVAKRIMGEVEHDFVMAMGDDKTDEDMFKALEHDAVTIKIGQGITTASYMISRQDEVILFLNNLISKEYNLVENDS